MFGRLTSRSPQQSGLEPVLKALQGPQLRPSCICLLLIDFSQVPWCMVLVKDPKANRAIAKFLRYGAVSRYVARSRVGESATRLWNYFLKITFFGFGLRWSFTSSYLNPKESHKDTLSKNGCQIIVDQKIHERDVLSDYLVDNASHLVYFTFYFVYLK